MTMFNNKANTMDFYIMIKDFFYSLSFSIITENVMVQSYHYFFFALDFHMNAGNTNICTRSVFDFMCFFFLYIFKCIG